MKLFSFRRVASTSNRQHFDHTPQMFFGVWRVFESEESPYLRAFQPIPPHCIPLENTAIGTKIGTSWLYAHTAVFRHQSSSLAANITMQFFGGV